MFSARANALLEEPGLRIATCPLTENGVVRVMSLPAYGRRGGLAPGRVRAQLQRACAELDHVFWPDDLSLRDDAVFDFDRLQGHQQITDAYLLALAVAHDGVLLSFDQKVALQAVRGAQPRHLRLL